jgi:hypothetical protein
MTALQNRGVQNHDLGWHIRPAHPRRQNGFGITQEAQISRDTRAGDVELREWQCDIEAGPSDLAGRNARVPGTCRQVGEYLCVTARNVGSAPGPHEGGQGDQRRQEHSPRAHVPFASMLMGAVVSLVSVSSTSPSSRA